MLRKIAIISLIGLFAIQSALPLINEAQAQQLSVQLIAQQSQTILPGDPRFAPLEARFYQSLGATPAQLVQQLQMMPTEPAAPQSTQASQAMQVSIRPELKDMDLKTEVAVNGKTLVLGTIELAQPGSIGGVRLVAGKYGVAAMKGSFVIVLINFSNGSLSAFIVIPDSLVASIGLMPIFFVFEVIFQVAFVLPFPSLVPPFFFPPFFPVIAGCPVLGRAIPVNVAVGSKAVIISAPSAGPPTLAIKDSGQLGTLEVESTAPANRSLRFELFSFGRVALGFVGGGATGRVHVPVFDTPFLLVASDDQGHAACLNAAVFFPGIISGLATSN